MWYIYNEAPQKVAHSPIFQKRTPVLLKIAGAAGNTGIGLVAGARAYISSKSAPLVTKLTYHKRANFLQHTTNQPSFIKAHKGGDPLHFTGIQILLPHQIPQGQSLNSYSWGSFQTKVKPPVDSTIRDQKLTHFLEQKARTNTTNCLSHHWGQNVTS